MKPEPFTVPRREYCAPYDKQHIRLTYITHYYLNQESTEAVTDLLATYSQYDSDLLSQIQFVIVDDCSPIRVKIPGYDLNIIWLRITDDITWNQEGARNLGAVYAKSDKILLTDLDNEFPEHTLRKMVAAINPGRHFYTPRIKYKRTGRFIEGNLLSRTGPDNIMFMSRANFMRLYGYDEEFAGDYGCEDTQFIKFQKYNGSWRYYYPKKYYCYRRQDINLDTAYHSLKRDRTRNTQINIRKRSELLYWDFEAGHSRLFLNFRWEVQMNKHMNIKPTRIKKRWWKQRLWLRNLFGIR